MKNEIYFAKNLSYLRRKYKMEQLDLASRLGKKSASSISDWEKGRYIPKAGTLNDIAKIFRVSFNQLMNEDLTISTPESQSIINIDEILDSRAAWQGEEFTPYDREILKQAIQDYINRKNGNALGL